MIWVVIMGTGRDWRFPPFRVQAHLGSPWENPAGTDQALTVRLASSLAPSGALDDPDWIELATIIAAKTAFEAQALHTGVAIGTDAVVRTLSVGTRSRLIRLANSPSRLYLSRKEAALR